MSDTELQQLVVYVGTEQKIKQAMEDGTITEDDMAISVDAPEYQTKLTPENAGDGITIEEVQGVTKISSTHSGGGGDAVWGQIEGTLSDQIDLQTALNGKQNTISDLNTIRSGASAGATALQPTDVINTTSSTATNKPLSANMGKSLQDQVDNLSARGRFLALWNCATGLAQSNPPESPYSYKSGDYFIVGTVASGSGTNYRPNGSSYTTGVASTTVETQPVDVDDVYYYDGTNWRLQVNTQKTVAFANVAGSPYDNTDLAAALNGKQDTISDLEAIRSGASAGATAVQPATLNSYALKTDVPTSGTGINIDNNKHTNLIQDFDMNYTVPLQVYPTTVDGQIYTGFENNPISGLSSDKTGLRIPDAFPASISTLMIQTKFMCSRITTWNCLMFDIESGSAQTGIHVRAARFEAYSVNNVTYYTQTAPQVDTWYWVRLEDDGTDCTFYSLVDNDYTEETLPEITSWQKCFSFPHSEMQRIFQENHWSFGLNESNRGEPIYGYIDFGNTKVQVNGENFFIPYRNPNIIPAFATTQTAGIVRASGREIKIDSKGILYFDNVSGYLTSAESPARGYEFTSGGSFALDNHWIYFTRGEVTNFTITNLNLGGLGNVNRWCELNFTSGSTATVITWPNGVTINWLAGSDDIDANGVLVPVANKRYNVMIWNDGAQINGISKGM